MESLRLRVKEADFVRGELTVRDGKGMKIQSPMVPGSVVPALQEDLRRGKATHQRDLAQGLGRSAIRVSEEIPLRCEVKCAPEFEPPRG